ncbi:hypothetical protein P4263_26070 [Bacillus thuringiensis]|nr:hypothetical protein [Bacillus thuringiensis]
MNKVKVQDKLKAFRIPIIGVIILFGVWFLFFRSSGITTQEFEEKLKNLSNGKVMITQSGVAPVDSMDKSEGKIGMYIANWNGFMISTRVENNNKIEDKAFFIMSKQVNLMDEIAIGQYRELIQYVTRIANPKLSVDEVNHIVDNDLNFNNQIMTGGNNTTSKDGMVYELKGGGEAGVFTFVVSTEKQLEETNKLNKSNNQN